ncbi:MAG: hypothetical protein KatS3mg031_0660 [Chitinophagales bacterium]|nr:MAG: hypothetical protein KatS3mg031_0660 [Chitinophagales bacterium]
MKIQFLAMHTLMHSVARIVILAILTFSGFLVSAQQYGASSPKVMIIPFDPYLYFSDADEQLAKYNNKSIKEVRTLFRYGLNINVNAKILALYETRPLLTDTAKGASEDLYNIYKNISYFKDNSMPSPEMKKEMEAQSRKKGFRIFSAPEESTEAHTSSRLKLPDEKQKEYINVKIHNNAMLQYLRKKYGTDLFVFINQFDLVTNYEHCLDRATNTFERDIKVHFSIFDYTGKQLAGDVAIVHFPSSTNDITEIMKNNFPVISEYLTGNLPKNYKANQPTRPSEEKVDSEVMEFEDN